MHDLPKSSEHVLEKVSHDKDLGFHYPFQGAMPETQMILVIGTTVNKEQFVVYSNSRYARIWS